MVLVELTNNCISGCGGSSQARHSQNTENTWLTHSVVNHNSLPPSRPKSQSDILIIARLPELYEDLWLYVLIGILSLAAHLVTLS